MLTAQALKAEEHPVEEVRIPALGRDFALDVFNKLHVMEMKPAFREAVAGHEDQTYKMAKTCSRCLTRRYRTM